MKTYNKTQVERKAKQHNISIDDTGYAIWADCPDGYVLKDYPGLHYVHYIYGDESFSKSECWTAIYGDIKEGIEKCDCEDCLTEYPPVKVISAS